MSAIDTLTDADLVELCRLLGNAIVALCAIRVSAGTKAGANIVVARAEMEKALELLRSLFARRVEAAKAGKGEKGAGEHGR